MSNIGVSSVELADHHQALPRWKDALVGAAERLSPLLPARMVAEVLPLPMTSPQFGGRVELGGLGESVLFKITATPFFFSSRPQDDKMADLPLILCCQLKGKMHFKQQNWAATLHPQDWWLLDTRRPHEVRWAGSINETLMFGMEPPCDAESRALLQRGLGQRLDGKTGISRVLQATLNETFRQLNRIDLSNGRAIQRAISVMAWDALREQLDAPRGLKPQDMRRVQLKEYIESRLADPELSNDTIAQACGVSVRSLQRSFAADPAGSTSNYILMRRLSNCAAALHDPKQNHRSITDICLSWGFNSTSHFSHVFKEQFGVAPRVYRDSSYVPPADLA